MRPNDASNESEVPESLPLNLKIAKSLIALKKSMRAGGPLAARLGQVSALSLRDSSGEKGFRDSEV